MKKYFILIAVLFALSGIALIVLFVHTRIVEQQETQSALVDIVDTDRFYRFEEIAFMREPRNHAASGAIGDRIYFIGGVNHEGDVVDLVEIYDTERNHWSVGPALPEPRRNASAATVDGTLYVFGGQDAHGNLESTVWALNGDSQTWEPRKAMEIPRVRHATVAIENDIFLLGGSSDEELPTSVDVFRIEENRWETVSELPESRFGFVAGVIQDRIYLAGGSRIFNDVHTTVDVFNPETGEWNKGIDIPTPRLNPTGLAVDGALIVAGGDDGSVASSVVDIYDPEQEYWISGVSLPTAKTFMTSAVIGGEVYFLGGGSISAPDLNNSAVVLIAR